MKKATNQENPRNQIATDNKQLVNFDAACTLKKSQHDEKLKCEIFKTSFVFYFTEGQTGFYFILIYFIILL